MSKQDAIFVVKAIIFGALLILAISADITAEVNFTENTRQGLYIKASEKELP